MKHLLYMILVLLPVCVFAQFVELDYELERYGGDQYDTFTGIVTLDNGFLLIGNTSSDIVAGWPNVYAERITPSGETLWTSSLNNFISDNSTAAIQTSSGDFLITGASFSAADGNTRAFIMRLSPSGALLSTVEFGLNGDDLGTGIFEDEDGYLVVGHSRPQPFGYADAFVARFSETGEQQWGELYGNAEDDLCTGAAQATNGNLLLTGYTHVDEPSSADLMFILVDNQGQQLNFQSISTELATIGTAAATLDTGFVVTGYTYITADSSLEHPRPFIVTVDTLGNPGPLTIIEDADPSFINAIAVTERGDIFLGGETFSRNDAIVLHVNQDGELLHQVRNRSNGWDTITALAWDEPRQTLHVAGTTSGGNAEMWDFFRGTIRPVSDTHSPAPVAQSLTLGTHPNPFNASSTVTIDLTGRAHLKVIVYDLLGRETMRLINGRVNAGRHQYFIDASSLASGVYFVSAELNGTQRSVRKLVLVR
ncbi:T9SS type A sorting domain-containing protein [bacterium]|nr:T9SS type A sorting domain-containing protein [bacterium]